MAKAGSSEWVNLTKMKPPRKPADANAYWWMISMGIAWHCIAWWTSLSILSFRGNLRSHKSHMNKSSEICIQILNVFVFRFIPRSNHIQKWISEPVLTTIYNYWFYFIAQSLSVDEGLLYLNIFFLVVCLQLGQESLVVENSFQLAKKNWTTNLVPTTLK